MENNLVAQKMEAIQGIFQQVQESFSKTETLADLRWLCESYEPEFRSIAYEAVAMCLGLNDLKAEDGLVSWRAFLESQNHLNDTQVHVGLGWAFAQQSIDPTPFLSGLEQMFRYRVLDGYGYYEGIFRKRKSILSQQKPEWKDEVASGAYDQGLGRSLWYLNHGKVDEAQTMLEKFPAERHADLWRGLGIAVAYVGGCDEKTLGQIFKSADTNKAQLATGAFMALVSRHYAGYVSEGTAFTCRLWCKQSADKMIAQNDAIKKSLHLNNPDAFAKWKEGIEAIFYQPSLVK
jgi:hypothetical protein